MMLLQKTVNIKVILYGHKVSWSLTKDQIHLPGSQPDMPASSS